MPITEIPQNRIYGYDYCGGSWRSIAVSRSGETIIAHGEKIVTQAPLIVTGASGGQPLGSGLSTSGMMIDRVILRVPEIVCSGTNYFGFVRNSGVPYGIHIGGYSGLRPYAGSGCLTSSFGLYLPPGEEKEIYVDRLDDIWVCSEVISGYPIHVAVEVIPCSTD